MKRNNALNTQNLLEILKKSGLIDNRIDQNTYHSTNLDDKLDSLSLRINKILELIKQHKPKRQTMLYFVMYDIENNKVRRLIARYLEKKGLIRIQKSIFVANTNAQTHEEIRKTLKEVQEAYDNNDSIVIVPISSDEIKSMKIIGKNIDIDLILGNTHTLIF